MKKYIFSALALSFIITGSVLAATTGFVKNNIWLSRQKLLEGETLKISSVVINEHDKDFVGEIVFYDNDTQIDGAITFSLPANGSSQIVSVNTVVSRGDHVFKAVIQNSKFVDEENDFVVSVAKTESSDSIFVDVDTDKDGLGDREEQELGTDPNKKDSDGDGEDDNVDPDPTNPKVFKGSDLDNDSISDAVDTDLDNDGLYNWEEEALGTDPRKYDTDGDGYSDKEDKFPLNPNKWAEEKVLGVKIESEPEEVATTTIQEAPAEEEIQEYVPATTTEETNKAGTLDFLMDFFAILVVVVAVLVIRGKMNKKPAGRKTK